MNRIKLPVNKLQALTWLFMLGFIALTFSCNKDFENVLPKTFPNDTAGRGSGKKVLLIILDGVKGDVVRQLAPTNITAINAKAAYSFDGLADDRRNAITNAAGWTNLITGVDYRAHGVQSEDFANLNVARTPTLFTRIKDNVTNARTVSIASTAIFNEILATDATVKVNANDDAAVKTAAVAELGNKSATVVVAQYHSAEVAGAANGYTANTPAYTNAIQALDAYIGNMLDAIKARPTYSSENWLVVIASNKGGAATSGGGPNSVVFEDQSRNTYVAFYNPRFNSTSYNQPDPNSYPFVGLGVRGTSNTTANGMGVLADASVGDFGTSGEYTVMIKVKNDAANNADYGHFFGNMATTNKREAIQSTGWDMMCWGNSYYLSFAGSYSISAGVVLRDARWHTLAFKLYNTGSTRFASLFQDGKKINTVDISGKNLTNTAALHFGPGMATTSANGTDMTFRDIAIYNVAFSDDDIISYSKRDISLLAPVPANLLGWWPLNDGNGSVAIDKSGKGNNFNITGSYSWANFSESTPNVAGVVSDSAYRSVFNGVDATLMIYNWLNISVPQSWGLMGSLLVPGVTLPTN
ncbi:DUF4983 domain-containing protein [Pedobacter sp. MC2016-05]|uniref:DUF4983 domain-containing protein n=1 Tax=Pedobacter sp. MC2016-05 TaxID=2994474 RepID=UPI002246F945|nr:DUF4983 domain-containing protein [Pedobacter sp. MC2016-05]MCX2473762.1 DUF4983 domain-containing protein [Pedobacter sp. MC2016-05]